MVLGNLSGILNQRRNHKHRNIHHANHGLNPSKLLNQLGKSDHFNKSNKKDDHNMLPIPSKRHNSSNAVNASNPDQSIHVQRSLQQYTWLYLNCNALTVAGRSGIIEFMTGACNSSKCTQDKIDIPIHRF